MIALIELSTVTDGVAELGAEKSDEEVVNLVGILGAECIDGINLPLPKVIEVERLERLLVYLSQ